MSTATKIVLGTLAVSTILSVGIIANLIVFTA
ncbi:hypothetical protein [Haloarcula nitratireducens]